MIIVARRLQLELIYGNNYHLVKIPHVVAKIVEGAWWPWVSFTTAGT